eukprot:Amastigsp_a339342_1176.p3 type:complete len:331 gc:universal Amastigsp_a339342_1176:1467-475(-)
MHPRPRLRNRHELDLVDQERHVAHQELGRHAADLCGRAQRKVHHPCVRRHHRCSRCRLAAAHSMLRRMHGLDHHFLRLRALHRRLRVPLHQRQAGARQAQRGPAQRHRHHRTDPPSPHAHRACGHLHRLHVLSPCRDSVHASAHHARDAHHERSRARHGRPSVSVHGPDRHFHSPVSVLPLLDRRRNLSRVLWRAAVRQHRQPAQVRRVPAEQAGAVHGALLALRASVDACFAPRPQRDDHCGVGCDVVLYERQQTVRVPHSAHVRTHSSLPSWFACVRLLADRHRAVHPHHDRVHAASAQRQGQRDRAVPSSLPGLSLRLPRPVPAVHH